MSGRHRGPAPGDEALFGPAALPALRSAVDDLSWLLGRGYAAASSLKLVGDRHRLKERQRRAVLSASCTAEQAAARRDQAVRSVRGEVVHVDGLNAIIVGESALSGGPVFVGRDGAHRDLASVHGAYRKVEETSLVIDELRVLLAEAQEVVVYLDRPVSNSGRLAERLRAREARWSVELVWDPDRVLRESAAIVATGDAQILDAGVRWIDLPRAIADRHPDRAWRVDLS
ncbi:MAG: DUF434 domain-containing protein [Sandaracinaceae bacterium]